MDDDTHIFCGHEYTHSNLEWALKVWQKKEIIDYLQIIKE